MLWGASRAGVGKEQDAIGRHPKSSSRQPHRRGGLRSSALLLVLVIASHASPAVASAGTAPLTKPAAFEKAPAEGPCLAQSCMKRLVLSVNTDPRHTYPLLVCRRGKQATQSGSTTHPAAPATDRSGGDPHAQVDGPEQHRAVDIPQEPDRHDPSGQEAPVCYRPSGACMAAGAVHWIATAQTTACMRYGHCTATSLFEAPSPEAEGHGWGANPCMPTWCRKQRALLQTSATRRRRRSPCSAPRRCRLRRRRPWPLCLPRRRLPCGCVPSACPAHGYLLE